VPIAARPEDLLWVLAPVESASLPELQEPGSGGKTPAGKFFFHPVPLPPPVPAGTSPAASLRFWKTLT